MVLKQYSFQFHELDISTSAIEQFIGYQEGSSPEPVSELIEQTLKMAPALCDIRGGYVMLDEMRVDSKSKTLYLDETEFAVKEIIAGQLKKSEAAALFLCTIGPGLGNYSKTLMGKGDLLEGYIADAVGSESVEAAVDKIQDDLEREVKAAGMNISDRYSPGYCGWEVKEQSKIFSFFPDKFCGITLNSSSLMDPIKSVSGIIGIGKNVKRKGYACNTCKIPNCIYRKLEYHERK